MQLDHDSLKFKAGTILSLAEGAGDVEAQVDIHNPGPHNHDDWLLAGVAANAIWRDDEGGKVWCWETAVIDGLARIKLLLVVRRCGTFQKEGLDA